jgi:metal-responsive CopG/Arc/MetJ family transcriptional regulator
LEVIIVNTQKVAISVPKDLITIVDEISREKGLSRSSFISMVLREKVLDEKEQKLRDAYNKVFSDDAIRKEQLDTCEWFELSGDNEDQGW